ncbi:ankyrin repeat domain-containing protein [Fluoribacter gormanii]|uniref:ankyrin repeat domain-containing protein n=1 Tax=Fluoribacter gormanii TaxID=464 RepID=UPI0022443614|nr:ankyrin repeat domain-containing protein [Fluoribacter gormanii]MCW8444751.1 ankyrin repeat domain-containing protein [Fluoribacter gormanii]MCW8469961.1 ankyrin repeat domain-containing protein [Fluoribacter gormanii]
MSKWEELLKSLSLNPKKLEPRDISKIELWYLQNVSKQPLYENSTTADKKLTPLKQEISHFLDTVADISVTKCSEKFDHLGGMNAIQYASKKGYDLYLNKILEQDRNAVNLVTSGQLSPLHLAALYGHHFAAEVLLEHGAKSNSLTRLQQTPAHLALTMPPSTLAKDRQCLMERKQAIFYDLLVNNPKNIIATDDSDNTLAHVAAENGFTTIVEDLLDYPGLLRMKNTSTHTPLHSAILNNQSGCIDVLKKEEALLAIPDKNGRLPIHYAAMYGQASMLEQLAKDPYLNCQDLNLKTPLMLAAELGHTDKVKLLIQKGANVILEDQYGKDVLHYALMSLNTELVTWLIANAEGLNVNQQDKSGRTALMNLLQETEPDDPNLHLVEILAHVLIDAGAQSELTDKMGKSLQDYLDGKFTRSSMNTLA